MWPGRTLWGAHKTLPGRRRSELCGPDTKRAGGQVIAEDDEPSVTGTAVADLMVLCPGTTPTGGRRHTGTCGLRADFA